VIAPVLREKAAFAIIRWEETIIKDENRANHFAHDRNIPFHYIPVYYIHSTHYFISTLFPDIKRFHNKIML
jgi:hypothetical protein